MTMSDFERNPRFVMELMEPREGLDKRATENAKSDVIIIWSAVCNFTVPRQAVLVRGRGCLVMFRMDVSLLPRHTVLVVFRMDVSLLPRHAVLVNGRGCYERSA